MISSNAVAAIAPYSCWSSSRRSPGMPRTPIARPRRGRPSRPSEPACLGQRLDHHPPDEVGELAHAVDVVAVVDDHPDPADVDHVEPAGRLEERRREGPQALADVVQVGPRRPRRGRGGRGVRDVHPGPAAERRRDEVRVEHGHRPRPELEHESSPSSGLEAERRPAAAGVPVDPVEAVLALGRRHAEVARPGRRSGGPSGTRAVVGVEDRRPRARHRLDDHALDVRQLADRSRSRRGRGGRP